MPFFKARVSREKPIRNASNERIRVFFAPRVHSECNITIVIGSIRTRELRPANDAINVARNSSQSIISLTFIIKDNLLLASVQLWCYIVLAWKT